MGKEQNLPQEVRPAADPNPPQAPQHFPHYQYPAGYGQQPAPQYPGQYPQAMYGPGVGAGQDARGYPPHGYPQQPGGPNVYGQPYGGQQAPPQYPQQYPQHAPHQQQQAAAFGIDVNDGPAGQAPEGGQGLFDEWVIPDDMKLTEDIDIKIRMAFIRKVYGILAVQLTITFGLALWFNLHRAAAVYIHNNVWVLILAACLVCCSVCGLSCVPNLARTSPTNYIILFVLAGAMGVVLGYSTGAIDTPAFAIAAGATAAVTLAVSLFACQTRWDFTGFGVYGFVALIVLMIFGLVAAIVRSRIVQLVYACLGTLLFSFYLIMDTQKIVGGKHRKYEFSIDDYAFGALALYLDIVNIFMFILTIVAATRN